MTAPVILEAVRWVSITCSALAILIGTPQWPRWWATYPPELLQGRLALAALNVAALYGTAESMMRGIPPGPRTAVVAVGSLWALLAVCWVPITDLTAHIRRRSRAAD
jgi:ABC-type phosphate transport system permease subunit